MFRGHSILIYFAVCATSLAGWNTDIWPASNTSPRVIVSSDGPTNTYAKDMWSWQCYSALVERASLAGVAPPTGPNFYRYEHDNLQAMKDWVEANCGNYLAITGTVEQLEETLASGIAFTNAVHYWTPTGMIAAFNLPTNFFDYTPYRDLNNYAGTQDSPQIYTNVVETGRVFVACGEQADNCYLYIELGSICGYKCYETTVITNGGNYGWDMLRLCITNLKWTYQQSSSNYITEKIYSLATNTFYEANQSVLLVTKIWEASPDLCTDLRGYPYSITVSNNIAGDYVECDSFSPVLIESNYWNRWPVVEIAERNHCTMYSSADDKECYSYSEGQGIDCIFKSYLDSWYKNDVISYSYSSNSFSGEAYVENTNAIAATVYMWERINMDLVETNDDQEASYSIVDYTTNYCSGWPCLERIAISNGFYYNYSCEDNCAEADVVFDSVSTTSTFDLVNGPTNGVNRWKIHSSKTKETNDYRLAFDISYSRWAADGQYVVNTNASDSAYGSCNQFYSYNSIWDRDEAWYEKLYIQMANPITPQVPYYLFEWDFEYD